MTTSPPAADLVIRNGRIRTMNRAQPWASALAVRSGRIVAVGDDAAMKPVTHSDTKTIDFKGAMAMPGMVDVHNHMMMGGQTDLYELRFPPGLSVTEIAGRLRAYAENVPAGQWIIGGQWGSDIIGQLNTSAAFAELDAASLGHPVMLRDDSYHNRWASSEAMKRCGITVDRPNPEKGEIGHDAKTGGLTGLLIEYAAGLVERTIAESGHYTEEMDRAALARSIAILSSFGVTAFLDAATMLPVLAALKGLDDRGELNAWAAAAMPVVEPSFMFGLSGDALLAQRETFRTVHVRPDFAKVFLDGVPAARTAAFFDAYLEDLVRGCCFRGSTLMTVPDLVRWLGKCEKQGIAVKIHCAGDAAVAQALDAIDVVRSFNGPTALVHHIAHASYIAPADIKRFAELGVAADLSPNIWYPTVFLEGHKVTMGEERALRFWPNKDLQAAGALMAGGSDWPVMPNPDPWQGIEGLVTRQNPNGDFPGVSLWPEQALDLDTVLDIYTINGARVLGLDRQIGSLEVGKSADIAVLDRDLYKIPAHDLADTKVSTTFFEGRIVYERA